MRALLFCMLAAGLGAAQEPAVSTQAKSNYEVDVPGSAQWTDTGIDLLPGARLAFTATGSVQYPQTADAAGPDGLARGWKDLLRVLPLNDSGRGALLGRVGAADTAPAFLIGAKREVRIVRGGRLFLGLNQTTNEAPDGSLHASIRILDPGSASIVAPSVTPDTARPLDVPGINNGLFSKIPRRIGDAAGDPGDMVNFLILGTEDQMRKVFQLAGWVTVDKNKTDAVLHGLMATLSKQSYVELPMSELYLFGRPQDYGMAHAEPFEVVASRHHLRLWRAPFTVDGEVVWVGAATHDIGFDKDQRNNGITHKIDAAVDDERKYVAQSLSDTGMVSKLGFFLPANPVSGAHTATGGSFHSDGKVLVMRLADLPDESRTPQ